MKKLLLALSVVMVMGCATEPTRNDDDVMVGALEQYEAEAWRLIEKHEVYSLDKTPGEAAVEAFQLEVETVLQPEWEEYLQKERDLCDCPPPLYYAWWATLIQHAYAHGYWVRDETLTIPCGIEVDITLDQSFGEADEGDWEFRGILVHQSSALPPLSQYCGVSFWQLAPACVNPNAEEAFYPDPPVVPPLVWIGYVSIVASAFTRGELYACNYELVDPSGFFNEGYTWNVWFDDVQNNALNRFRMKRDLPITP